MKTKTILISLIAVAIMCACKDEAAEYRNAMQSNDVETLNAYLQDFSDAPAEHLDSVKVRLSEIIADNDDYLRISYEDYIINKYEAAQSYLSLHPEGLYAAEVKTFLEECAEEYRLELKRVQEAEYERKYGEYRDRLVNFTYDRGNTWIALEAPDMNGKGKGVYYGSNIFGKGYTQLNYQINKKGELIVTPGKCTDDFAGVTGLFIINVYSDCLYIEKDGESILYYRNLVSDTKYKDCLKKYNF